LLKNILEETKQWAAAFAGGFIARTAIFMYLLVFGVVWCWSYAPLSCLPFYLLLFYMPIFGLPSSLIQTLVVGSED
jgi:hypothetical protein